MTPWHTVFATELGDLVLVRDTTALRGLDLEHDQTSASPTPWDLRELRGRSVHPA